MVYSQFTSRMTSISKNEMNISNSSLLCLAFEWNLEDFSGNLSKKDTLTELQQI